MVVTVALVEPPAVAAVRAAVAICPAGPAAVAALVMPQTEHLVAVPLVK